MHFREAGFPFGAAVNGTRVAPNSDRVGLAKIGVNAGVLDPSGARRELYGLSDDERIMVESDTTPRWNARMPAAPAA